MAKRWWLVTTPMGVESVAAGGTFDACGAFYREVQLAPIDSVVVERGTREWAIVMAMRGIDVAHSDDREAGERSRPHAASSIINHTNASGWYELPAPWEPKKGEVVRGYRGNDRWSGPYWEIGYSRGVLGHWLGGDDGAQIWVERVEPMEPSHG